MTKMHPLVQWWLTPKLPVEHTQVSIKNEDKTPTSIFKLYLFRFFVHPIKRRTARYYLKFLKAVFGIKVVAITGSAGKTTTKEMVASILGRQEDTVASYKNIDPVYNIPTTILKCKPWTKYLVLEFGVEYLGEMEFYFWLAKPDISVITNIYPTHTEFFGDVRGVAREKLKIIKLLKRGDWAILNHEDKTLRDSSTLTNARVIWCGVGTKIFSKKISISKKLHTSFELHLDGKKTNITIPIAGRHNVLNALAASASTKILGTNLKEIKEGLENFSVPEHRKRLIKQKSGAKIVDDSYNNNPEAAKATINTFVKVFKREKKIVVFGDMLELGRHEERFHTNLGVFMVEKKIDFLIGVGNASKITVRAFDKQNKNKRSSWVENQSEVDGVLSPLLNKNTAVLIKGSRSVGLDKLVERLFEK